ncbi:MAG: MFS transporter [Planctomycetota bacterium]
MSERPRLPEKIAYGFGDLASVLYWQTFMLYLPYFYTDVFRIPAGVAATMFLVSRIFDGINDPVMGMIADRTTTRWGRFRPWLLWLCVPFALMGVLTFTTPNFGPTGKIWWAYLTFFGMMLLYTGINIPYTALLGVISPNSSDRTSVSSIKFMFAFAAGIIVSATLLPMVKRLGGGNEARGWQFSFIIYGMAAIVFFLIAFAGPRERVQPSREQKPSVWEDLKTLFANRPWWILLATTLTFILFIAIRSSVTVHYFKYYVGKQVLSLPFFSGTYDFETLTSAFNTVGQAFSLLGVFLVDRFARLIGKKSAFLSLFVVTVVSYAAFYLLRPDQVALMFLLQAIASMSGGPMSVLLWAMYADTADYAEWKLGRRATGLVFSASTMSQKIGWAFGTFVALQLMASVGFTANEDQAPESLRGMVLLFSLIPAGFGVVSILIATTYPLGEPMMDTITNEIKRRRETENSAPTAD